MEAGIPGNSQLLLEGGGYRQAISQMEKGGQGCQHLPPAS